MCGITGKYNFLAGEPVSRKLIQGMTDTIVYRGPDDAGVYVDGPIGLGHRRLSIIDLSEAGHQPMEYANGRLWITFNGEIYNFLDLRSELIQKGYAFRSDCDTEVILALYQEYGEACLDHLRGMFAFAIWDREKRKLFLARDRIGKKPLFYYANGKTFVFASEIKAILQDPVVEKKIRYDAFADYFKYLYVPDPKTIYQDIHKLRPGHYLTCTEKGIKETQYWDISFSELSFSSEKDICEHLDASLNEAVRLRMISDVPLGAFLSGGIDSSAVVAMMAENQSSPVTTCSIGFDSERFDEIQYAKVVAELFNTDHHEFTVKQKAEAILEDLAFHFDEPFADASAVPTYYVSKLARKQVTVALAGDGGDENFAGYEKYFMDDLENRFRCLLPASFRSRLFPGLAGIFWERNPSVFQKAYTLLNSLSREKDYGFYLSNTEFEDKLFHSALNEETRRRLESYDPSQVTLQHYQKADTDNHLSRILYTDMKTYLPGDILVKVDRMSMAHSLEVRAPILDHRFMEFVASIPPQMKYRKREKKYILKKALSRRLPESILYRKKMGFSVPQAEWLRGELKTVSQNMLFSGNPGISNFFKMEIIQRIWNQHQTKKRNHATILWSLLMFEFWFRKFMK